MAKGNMLLGRAVGSVGDITFSVVNGKQVIKAKPATVKNRQTKAQMIQRILMNTVAQAYSKMSEICDHSFEGLQQGQACMSYFMKKNLTLLRNLASQYGLDDPSNPAVVPVGSSFLATNSYEIAKGTLPEIFFLQSSEYKALSLGSANTYASVIAQLGAQRGDQLTILTISGNNVLDLKFNFCRIILDPVDSEGNQLPLSTAFVDGQGAVVSAHPRNENYGIELEVQGTELTIMSAYGYTSCRAAILSRQGEDGNWKRSNASFVMGPDLQIGYSIEDAYEDFLSGGIDVASSMYLNNATRGRAISGGSTPTPTPTPSADTLKLNGNTVTIGGSGNVAVNTDATLVLTLADNSVRIGQGVQVGSGAVQTLTAGANTITVPGAAAGTTTVVKIGAISGSAISNPSTLFSVVVPSNSDDGDGD